MKGVAHCGYVMIAELIVFLTIVSQNCGLRRFVNVLYWTGVHDFLLCRKAVPKNPYKTRKGSS